LFHHNQGKSFFYINSIHQNEQINYSTLTLSHNIDYSLDEDDNEEEKQEKIIDKQEEINQINNGLKISIPNLDAQNKENINQKEKDLINQPTDNYIRESIILNSKIDNQQILSQKKKKSLPKKKIPSLKLNLHLQIPFFLQIK